MVNLDSRSAITDLDARNMRDLLYSFPEQILDGNAIGKHARIPLRYVARCQEIVFTGLGGSAIGADLIRSYLARKNKNPIFVNRNYTLPGFVSSKTLVVVSSYSGNTEESVSAFREAKKRKAKIIAVTSGGALARSAKQDNLPLLIIPSGLPPRCALGYSFFIPLVVLWKLGFTGNPRRDIRETVKILKHLRVKYLNEGVVTKKNIAKKLAKIMHGKFTVLYGGQDHFDSVVTRWRGQIGENAKALASCNVVPEMNHNEIVGWRHPRNVLEKFIVIILRDKGDHPRIKRRMDISRRIIEKSGTRVIELYSIGSSLLARMFSLIYIGDYASYYLALLYKQDPTAVERIDFLKKMLAQGRLR